MSPVPWKELAKLDPEAAAAVEPLEEIEAKALNFGGQGPPGWVKPQGADPDLSVWDELFLNGAQAPAPAPAPPPTDENACHGISGDYWVMSRYVAVDNVEDFCGQTEKTMIYNAGSVNELELSVRKLDDDTRGPEEAPDCVARFTTAVIGCCDGDDPINNPHNYKFGSTLTTVDGWEYTMTPLSQQVNEVECDVSYKFFLDAVEIRGKNWPDAELGANGAGLRDELDGCGLLTEWKFDFTPDDCCFYWYASAQLPIGTKNCVGNAVISAGGSDKDNCHGAGKRDRKSPSIDRWPGYGDEGRHVFKNTSRTLDADT